jgi:hypothetical protein
MDPWLVNGFMGPDLRHDETPVVGVVARQRRVLPCQRPGYILPVCHVARKKPKRASAPRAPVQPKRRVVPVVDDKYP